jgi:hypothetical protein
VKHPVITVLKITNKLGLKKERLASVSCAKINKGNAIGEFVSRMSHGFI